ncbi:MAG: hypothetical protein ACPL3C_09230 [Pyrobaculum sp.]
MPPLHLFVHPRVEEWPLLLGPLYKRLVEAVGGVDALRRVVEERPWVLRTYLKPLAAFVQGPFAPALRRFVESGVLSTAPLVKFAAVGPGGEVDVLLRCGPAAVLTQPQNFYQVYNRQCTAFARLAPLKAPRGRRSWGLAVRRPGEFFCRVAEELVGRMGLPGDPWALAAYYRREGGYRRSLQPLASWIYYCRHSAVPEADYLLGRLSAVYAPPALKLYAVYIGRGPEHLDNAPGFYISKGLET